MAAGPSVIVHPRAPQMEGEGHLKLRVLQRINNPLNGIAHCEPAIQATGIASILS